MTYNVFGGTLNPSQSNSIYAVVSERVNGSLIPEEKPSDELMSDMLPVNRRHPPFDDGDVAGPDAAAHDDDNIDDDDVVDSENGKKFG